MNLFPRPPFVPWEVPLPLPALIPLECPENWPLDWPFPLKRLPFPPLPLAELDLPFPFLKFSGERPWLDWPWFPLPCLYLFRWASIFIHLLDRGFGRIIAGFLCHSFCIGLLPPVILSGMRLATVGVTVGQTNSTVFRLRVFYILLIPTFRRGILAQSFMELLRIGIRQFFPTPPTIPWA